jgi:hypothetical protein
MRIVLATLLLTACAVDTRPELVLLPDGALDQETCDVLMQSGCLEGQKCSWVREANTTGDRGDYIVDGRIDCVSDGTLAVGEYCWRYPADFGPLERPDECIRGSYCDGGGWGMGICRRLCVRDATVSGCDPDDVCVDRSIGLFLGVCVTPP